jgi:hypothetical protein
VVATAVAGGTVAAAAALSTLTLAQAATFRLTSAVPPPPTAALSGTWVNTSPRPASRHLAELVVSATARGITVDAFPVCPPRVCEWGRVAGTVFGPSVGASSGTSFTAQWDTGTSRTLAFGTYRPSSRALTVQEFTSDSGGQPDVTVTETFTRGKTARVTKTGTSASGVAADRPVPPAGALAGTWLDNAASNGVRAVELSAGRRGQLRVHAYGACSPVPCDWGTTAGVTFGSSATAASGNTFLAAYRSAFETTVLDGTVTAGGTRLILQIWTEFTDGSDRSNYVITDSLVPLR